MKSFKEFVNEEYLALESLRYIDRTLFKNICEGKYKPSDEELERFSQSLVFEDSDEENKYDNVKYMQNDEEVELIKKYQANPNSKEGMDALNKLVENKMPWVYDKVGKHLINHSYKQSHYDDLVQEASLAVVKAIEDYDINSGTIFNAFAKKYVTTALLNAYNPQRHKVDTLQTISIDTPVSGSRGEWADKDMTVGDTIPDESLFNSILHAENEEEENYQRALLNDWLKQLPEDEEKAIKMYFLPEEGEKAKTLNEIGKEIKMSKMGVQKLIKRVTAKLRQFAKEEGIVDSDK